jgi:hypothetical protein
MGGADVGRAKAAFSLAAAIVRIARRAEWVLLLPGPSQGPEVGAALLGRHVPSPWHRPNFFLTTARHCSRLASRHAVVLILHHPRHAPDLCIPALAHSAFQPVLLGQLEEWPSDPKRPPRLVWGRRTGSRGPAGISGGVPAEINNLRLPYLFLLAEQGFVIVHCHISKLTLETKEVRPLENRTSRLRWKWSTSYSWWAATRGLLLVP